MLKRIGCFVCLVSVLLLARSSVFAQDNVAGTWVLTTSTDGLPPSSGKLVLNLEGDKLTGTVQGGTVEGTISGSSIHWVVKPRQGDPSEYTGTISGGVISGTAAFPKAENPAWSKGTFTATRVPQRPPGPPRVVDFHPTTFYAEFSGSTKPVLNVWPGDTVRTTTVDAGGKDKDGMLRAWGGNPQTGPFYIETAMPGDIIAVHLKRIRLNRDWAFSDDILVSRVLGPLLERTLGRGSKMLRWRLDRERGLATPESPGENLKQFSVPVRPMLGCVAVGPGRPTPYVTQDSGGFGGNMDLNEIVEGSTVYLRIAHPGALLYIGDGHAVQGDGELTGNALETSMDVEFSVDVLPGKPMTSPRVESPTHMMALGLAGSVDDALRDATFSLVQWLQQNYKLNSSEIVQILGTCIEYRVNEIADRNVGVVAMIKKERLAGLVPATP